MFIWDDWAEDHHDVELESEDGRRLARARLPEGMEGISRLHALVGEHAPATWAELTPAQAAGRVVIGIETDRGPWVSALRAGGRLSSLRYQSAVGVALSRATLHLWGEERCG